MNAVVKHRSPWGVWWLSLVTFGIYYLVWYVKINKEFAAYANGQITVGTGGLWFSQCVPIANFVSVANTSGRLAQVQTLHGQEVTTSGGMSVLAYLWFFSNTRYVQRRWNATVAAMTPEPAPATAALATQ